MLIEALRSTGNEPLGFIDSDASKVGTTVCGIPCIGDDSFLDDVSRQEVILVNALGSTSNLTLRKSIFEKFKAKGFEFFTVVHSSAIIARDALLMEGTQIMAGAILQPSCRIGVNSIINTKASVDHDCVIGHHVHVAPGVTLSGGVSIGDEAHIGTGAVIIQNMTIGSGSLVGAGSVVVKDVPPGMVVKGVPAKPVIME